MRYSHYQQSVATFSAILSNKIANKLLARLGWSSHFERIMSLVQYLALIEPDKA